MTEAPITMLSRLSPVPGRFLETLPIEARWWAECLVHAVALGRFYRDHGVTRLNEAMQLLIEDAQEGVARDVGLPFVHPLALHGERGGALAVGLIDLNGALEWWKAGAQASFGLAAVMGLPGIPDHERLGALPVRHHKFWRLGLRIVIPEEDHKRVLSDTCGDGAPEFLDLVAERYVDRVGGIRG